MGIYDRNKVLKQNRGKYSSPYKEIGLSALRVVGTKPLKKDKKLSRKQLIKKLDDLIGKKVRARGQCARDGKITNLQWAHIVSRSYHKVRWLEDNALCLCRGCHFYFTNHPVEFARFVVEKIGLIRYEELKELATSYEKQDLQSFYEELKNN